MNTKFQFNSKLKSKGCSFTRPKVLIPSSSKSQTKIMSKKPKSVNVTSVNKKLFISFNYIVKPRFAFKQSNDEHC